MDLYSTKEIVMNPIALLFLAFSMSTDAFSVAIAKGARLTQPRFIAALKIGLVFGLIEAITPLIGWLIGRFATMFVDASFIEAWDHWIAFAILSGLGLHLLISALNPDAEDTAPSVNKPSLLTLSLTAFGTSIDALAVGVSLAFVEVNILFAAALIGMATTIMVTLGILLGKALGKILGQKAEIFGGIALIAIGTWILLSHIFSL